MSEKSLWFTAEELVDLMPTFLSEVGGPSMVAARDGDVWICGELRIRTIAAGKRPDLVELIAGLLVGQGGGRRLLACDLAPAYVDAVVLRWQAMTGLEATLEEDGRAFAVLQADRLADVVGDDAAWA